MIIQPTNLSLSCMYMWCMYVCMYIYICVCMYVCLCVYMHQEIFVLNIFAWQLSTLKNSEIEVSTILFTCRVCITVPISHMHNDFIAFQSCPLPSSRHVKVLVSTWLSIVDMDSFATNKVLSVVLSAENKNMKISWHQIIEAFCVV